MPEIKIEEHHSEEVQDIMGHIPKWIVRWGITLIFSILSLIIIGSYFFRYPVIITAPLIITTSNTPAPLVAKKSGRIEKWFVQDGAMVSEGQPIALLASGAVYEDVILLETWLKSLSLTVEGLSLVHLKSNLELGDLQEGFYEFSKSIKQFQGYIATNRVEENTKLLQAEISRKEAYYNQMLDHLEVKKEEFQLTKIKYTRDSTYYFKGGYGIIEMDYQASRLNYLQQKATYIAYVASFNENEAVVINLKQEVLELEGKHKNKIDELRNIVMDNSQRLASSLKQWKMDHVVSSPIKGQLAQTKYWSENQAVGAGESIAAVVPQEQSTIVCRAMVNSEGLGKIKVGQKVNVKLSGFPYMEYGVLLGEIGSISLVPIENDYVVEIDLSNGMTSTYKEKLKFVQEMEGVAEIITEDSRLIYKLIGSLERILK